jgi:ChrR-like protein with cupin domain
MSQPSRAHDQDHAELLVLYALGALPLGETSSAEARISACAGCREELRTLRPLVDAFASWPTDVLRPTAALWDRLAQRIGAETGQAPLPSPPPRAESEWQQAAPGISVKLLATDEERHRVSMLVRLAPGTDYPPHRHAGVEELHLLDGELIVDDKTLQPGDHIRAETGSEDHRVWSGTGCTCVLLTSSRDALL